MKLLQYRLYDNGNDSTGILYYPDEKNRMKYLYTLEDEHRDKKVKGETRIPAGFYEIKLRKEGGFYEKYCNHKDPWIAEKTKMFGIPHLQNVLGFKYILIHILNTEDQTDGCIGVGLHATNNSIEPGFISDSTAAYKMLMKPMYIAFSRGEEVLIYIKDFDIDVSRLLFS